MDGQEMNRPVDAPILATACANLIRQPLGWSVRILEVLSNQHLNRRRGSGMPSVPSWVLSAGRCGMRAPIFEIAERVG
jgi:hypothetical protein